MASIFSHVRGLHSPKSQTASSKFYLNCQPGENKKIEDALPKIDKRQEVTELVAGSDFLMRLKSIENDRELAIKVATGLQNWLGKRVSNVAQQREKFFELLGREFEGDGERLIEFLQQNWESLCDELPQSNIFIQSVNFNKIKNTENVWLELRISKDDSTTSKPLRVDDAESHSETIFVDDFDNDSLIVDVYKLGKKIASTSACLRNITPGEVTSLSLKDLKHRHHVGSINILVRSKNVDRANHRNIFFNAIHEKFFEPAMKKLFNVENLALEKSPFFEYSVEITEKIITDVDHLLVKSSDFVTNHRNLKFNNTKVDFENGRATCKLGDILSDTISIKLYKVDSRSPRTARKIINNLENVDSDAEDPAERQRKISPAKLSSMFTSPEKVSSAKRRLDMVYFHESIPIMDIPWKEGKILKHQDFVWDFKIQKSEDRLFLNDEQIRELMLIAYYKTLKEASYEAIATWSGNMDETLRPSLIALGPLVEQRAWWQAKAWAVFTLRKELWPQLNPAVLDSLLEYLNDEDLLKSFKTFCIKKIATFDSNIHSANLSQVANLVNSLATLMTSDAMIESELKERIKIEIEKNYYANIQSMVALPLHPLEEQLKNLEQKISGQWQPTLKLIASRFGNYALATWCPLLAEAYLLFGLNRFKQFNRALEIISDVENEPAVHKFHEISFLIYKELQEISRYLASSQDELYSTFEPCLPHWAECAAAKAREQVTKVILMEQEKHEVEDTKEKEKNRRRHFFEALRSRIAKHGEGHTSDMTRSVSIHTLCRNFSEAELDEWQDMCLNVNGIFLSCNVTWKHLAWNDPFKSITLFGSLLFDCLLLVFQEYIEKLRVIVNQDNNFDHVELVIILNSCFNSVKYLDDFSVFLASESQRLLDITPEEKQADVLSSIKTVVNKFGIALPYAEAKAEELARDFCEGQRKEFRRYIKAKKLSTSSSSDLDSPSSDSECFQARSLLQYLDELLRFFEYSLDLQEKTTRDYRKLIKQTLFAIFDEEMSKFYEEASVDYEKHRDPAVFGDLYESIKNSIEFRRNISIQDSEIIKNLEKDLPIRTSPSTELISNYLEEIFRTKLELSRNAEESLGEVVFHVGHDGTDLFLRLKSISNLKPRQNRDDCNFRLTVSLLPLTTDANNYKITQNGLIYAQKNSLLFDVPVSDEGPEPDPRSYNFEFQLSNNFTLGPNNLERTFLEINLVDISRTKTNYIFRGNLLMPLAEVPEILNQAELDEKIDCRQQKKFTRIPSLIDTKSIGKLSWDELSERKDIVSKSFIEDYEKFRREKRIPFFPRSDEWAEKFSMRSCIFPKF